MPSDDGDPVRTRVPRSTLAVDAGHDRLIEDLVDARLLSSDEGDVRLAHEALAREWPRLREWLEEDVDGQRIFRHLAAAAERIKQQAFLVGGHCGRQPHPQRADDAGQTGDFF